MVGAAYNLLRMARLQPNAGYVRLQRTEWLAINHKRAQRASDTSSFHIVARDERTKKTPHDAFFNGLLTPQIPASDTNPTLNPHQTAVAFQGPIVGALVFVGA